ncbi:hypothetical protein COV18_04695 [Candidatus Woesearchaeota archaeon CG10_big_fil_rev_8_21_14_0_10_37_12]|nr:MAG: hypothetical protein COV18_04695 [Candidatus Woesearchaeota archaeon CG10_big_fil_rev_8_21_14_0_10_37_12]
MGVHVFEWEKEHTPKEPELEVMLEKKGVNSYRFVMEKNEVYGAHSHDKDEIRVVVYGEVEFCADGRQHILKPGDRIHIGAGTVHTVQNLAPYQSVLLGGAKE